MATVYIYGLHAHDDGTIMYVGCTQDPKLRLQGHISSAKGGQVGSKHDWIRRLLVNGKKLDFLILEQCAREQGPEREAFWVEKIRSENPLLTNWASPRPYALKRAIGGLRLRNPLVVRNMLMNQLQLCTIKDIIIGLKMGGNTVSKLLAGAPVQFATMGKLAKALNVKIAEIAEFAK